MRVCVQFHRAKKQQRFDRDFKGRQLDGNNGRLFLDGPRVYQAITHSDEAIILQRIAAQFESGEPLPMLHRGRGLNSPSTYCAAGWPRLKRVCVRRLCAGVAAQSLPLV